MATGEEMKRFNDPEWIMTVGVEFEEMCKEIEAESKLNGVKDEIV